MLFCVLISGGLANQQGTRPGVERICRDTPKVLHVDFVTLTHFCPPHLPKTPRTSWNVRLRGRSHDFPHRIRDRGSYSHAITLFCSMADETPASRDIQAIDLGELRKVLLSNSTKQRTSELNQLNDKLVSQGR